MVKISKERLEKLYRENTNKDVCEKLNISHVTLIRMVEDAGIEKKEKGGGFTKKYEVE